VEARAYWPVIVLFPFLVVTLCRQHHLFNRLPSQDFLDESFRVSKSVLLATLLLTGLLYLGNYQLSRYFFLALSSFNILVLLGCRLVWRFYFERLVKSGKAGTHVLIVGATDSGLKIANEIQRNRSLGYVVKGFLHDELNLHPSILGKVRDLPTVARDHFADEVIIALPPKSRQAKEAILQARELCLDITVVPEMFDELGVDSAVEYVGSVPIIELHREPIPAIGIMAKRFMDIVLSSVGLVAIAPFVALLAIIIYIDSPGPIFYVSDRVGKKGRIFGFYKLRSMVPGAELRKADLKGLNERDGVLFKMTNDPRVTRIGKVMRKYSLDEIPQIWNVLRGEMSLVGPRPPLVSEYKNYRPEHRRRLDVVPGLTGMWQVGSRKDPSFETYVAQDLQYIENWSLLLDFKILLKTIPAVLRGTGL
jgi:exopolysaccharide biosynthesis polyprenyl glycosylphosphotransferase